MDALAPARHAGSNAANGVLGPSAVMTAHVLASESGSG